MAAAAEDGGGGPSAGSGASGYGVAARELIAELYRSDVLPPYNVRFLAAELGRGERVSVDFVRKQPGQEEAVRRTAKEIEVLFTEVTDMLSLGRSGGLDDSLMLGCTAMHATALRLKRCLMAYTHERLRRIERLRWDFGAVLPEKWATRLSRAELDYVRGFNGALSNYMQAVQLDLTADQEPPRHLHLLVRVRATLGDVVLPSGSVVKLSEGDTLLLRRSDIEHLVRRGALEEVATDMA